MPKQATLAGLLFSFEPIVPNLTTLSIQSGNGLLKGSFKDSAGRRIPLPRQGEAIGLFLGPDSTGALEVKAEE